jgi:hypothetical protein
MLFLASRDLDGELLYSNAESTNQPRGRAGRLTSAGDGEHCDNAPRLPEGEGPRYPQYTDRDQPIDAIFELKCPVPGAGPRNVEKGTP